MEHRARGIDWWVKHLKVCVERVSRAHALSNRLTLRMVDQRWVREYDVLLKVVVAHRTGEGMPAYEECARDEWLPLAQHKSKWMHIAYTHSEPIPAASLYEHSVSHLTLQKVLF